MQSRKILGPDRARVPGWMSSGEGHDQQRSGCVAGGGEKRDTHREMANPVQRNLDALDGRWFVSFSSRLDETCARLRVNNGPLSGNLPVAHWGHTYNTWLFPGTQARTHVVKVARRGTAM